MSTVRQTSTGIYYSLPRGKLCSTDMTRFTYTWSCGDKEGVGYVDCFSREDFLKLLEYRNEHDPDTHYQEDVL